MQAFFCVCHKSTFMKEWKGGKRYNISRSDTMINPSHMLFLWIDFFLEADFK